jgi:hypothetical protein
VRGRRQSLIECSPDFLNCTFHHEHGRGSTRMPPPNGSQPLAEGRGGAFTNY